MDYYCEMVQFTVPTVVPTVDNYDPWNLCGYDSCDLCGNTIRHDMGCPVTQEVAGKAIEECLSKLISDGIRVDTILKAVARAV